jgi:NADH dehydrogenase [ubiquinone] 1 alpha subcomplex assembly factor 7
VHSTIAHAGSLAHTIRSMIAAEGPMPVSRFMALALGHPRYGYYMTRDPLGAEGDFTTAPEVSQMFGELLGLWCAEVWRLMRAPRPVLLVELGPGRGTLMRDALRASKILPEFRSALDVHLVETSPVLREAQRAMLAAPGVPVQWHERAETLPDGPLLALANEFVDALPIDQFVMAEDGWHERRVNVNARGRFVFSLAAQPTPGIDAGLPPMLRHSPRGALLERRHYGPLNEIARRVAWFGGAALVVDYGHARTAFGDTLQAVRAHEYADPLLDPGEADLTAHVDFEALAAEVKQHGARAHGPVAQGTFLRRLGIELRAERLRRHAGAGGRTTVDAALARLIGPAPGMGELFKALSFAHRDLPCPPGFDSAEGPGEPRA